MQVNVLENKTNLKVMVHIFNILKLHSVHM